jgi:hypothetical protein
MSDESNRLTRFGQSAVNLDRLLVVSVYEELDGIEGTSYAELTFETGANVRVPNADGKLILDHLERTSIGGIASGTEPTGTQANTSDVKTNTLR